MAKNPAPSPSVPADAPPAPAQTSRLRVLLGRLAEARAAAGRAGVPFTFGSGMNLKPNRFHLDHDNGEVIAALKAIGEEAQSLLSDLP
jgi:hypothetical protein